MLFSVLCQTSGSGRHLMNTASHYTSTARPVVELDATSASGEVVALATLHDDPTSKVLILEVD